MKKVVEWFFVCVGLFTASVCIAYTAQNLYIERKADGYLIWDRIIVCDPTGTCYHELGHAKDVKLGYPSHSPEFKKAVDEYLEWCKKGKKVWPTECDHLENFPGINGNPLRYGAWGGYFELYADLFMLNVWDNLCVPENIKVLFNIHWRERKGE